MMPRISWSVGLSLLDKLTGTSIPLRMSSKNPPKAPLKEFERWREACEDKSLEPEDYLGTLVEATEFPDEALVVLMSMVWPRLDGIGRPGLS